MNRQDILELQENRPLTKKLLQDSLRNRDPRKNWEIVVRRNWGLAEGGIVVWQFGRNMWLKTTSSIGLVDFVEVWWRDGSGGRTQEDIGKLEIMEVRECA